MGSSPNQANYNNAMEGGHSTDVGAFSGSGSFYGTFDQSGNVFQWNDQNGTAGFRGVRGGHWFNGLASNFPSSWALYFSMSPSFDNNDIGFRLASPV